MIDRTDPEYAKLREERKLMMDGYWRDGLIGDATYLRSIMLLGYDDRVSQIELALLKLERERNRKCWSSG